MLVHVNNLPDTILIVGNNRGLCNNFIIVVYRVCLNAGDMEWLKTLPSSSTGPPPMPVQQPMPSDEEQRHIQQMLLAMHSMPPAGSRWAAPPVGTAGHVPGMPHAAAMHPAMQHANHVGPQSVDSAVEQSVSLSFCADALAHQIELIK